MENIPKNIWRQYDIRGTIPNEINPEVARDIGRAYGTIARRANCQAIAVGHDCRSSSEDLHNATMEGIAETGCNVRNIGMCPTPVLYFVTHHYKQDGGMVVTASHNPPQYNGFKLRLKDRALYGDDIQKMAALIIQKDFEIGQGSVTILDPTAAYIDYISSTIQLKKKLRVVIDAGNGSAGPTAISLLSKIGCDIIPLYCDPDGTFPNHIPDPTIPAYMRKLSETVISERADLGVGLDGDGDRVGIVTPSGRLLFGDDFLILFVRHMSRIHRKLSVVFDVKCSMGLIEQIQAVGGSAVMWKTGYPLIQAKMKECGALLGGEMSGHMYFADRYYGFDDGMYAACRLLELLSEAPVDLDSLISDMPHYPSTPELRLHCSDSEKFKILPKISGKIRSEYNLVEIDGLRYSTPQGWGLIRVSNTEPAIVMRIEARTQNELERMIAEAVEMLSDSPVDVAPLKSFTI